jgi:zeaxanthin glucosyltransferase
MGTLGFFSDYLIGHLNPMVALASELKNRGHDVIFCAIIDTKETVTASNLDFRQIGSKDFPHGSVRELNEQMRKCKGKEGTRSFIRNQQQQCRAIFRDGPAVVRKLNLDGLVIDQSMLGGGTVAEHVGLPFIHIITGCPLNRNDAVPPFFSSRPYRSSFVTRIRNRLEYSLVNRVMRPVLDLINEQRRAWKLARFRTVEETFSTLAQITQLPEVLEYPAKISLPYFHYAGPFYKQSSRRPVNFPWEQLIDRPLIYASLGTLMHHFPEVSKLFPMIVEACANLNLQLVLSLGGATDSAGVSTARGNNQPGGPIVVSYAPQLELLAKAAATITHGGLNTTLEALSHGLPLVALPIGYDQNGVAARLQWSKAGVVVSARKRSADEIRQAVKTVLQDGRHRSAAKHLQTEIHNIQGLKRAADIVEKTFNIAKP